MPKQTNIEQEALQILKSEKTQWEDGSAFITEKVSFQMRNLIRQLRKNYWGVFDSPTDPTTGRKKIWVPLTEMLVEAVVKNIDLDTKDINFRAKKAESIGLTAIVRNVVKNKLDEMSFGEELDDFERQLSIDGTAVWKTSEQFEDRPTQIVDLLNFYIDPTARSIQEASAVIERSVVTIDEFQSMDGWDNKEDVEGKQDIDRVDHEYGSYGNDRGETRFVEVYERWGKMPKSLLTGKAKDTEMVDGHIVASGIGSDAARIHLIEENKKGIKPYEEAWYTRVPGRWYGRGIAEKVMMLQLWLNTIVNIRINRSFVSQLGIFKIKRGAGITPQMVSRLAANGAILVNNQDDIEQFVMQEASQASYQDESTIQDWAQRITSAFEVVTGEQLPATTTATAVATQTRTAQSQFVMIREGLGMFLQRWLKRHFLPLATKTIGKDEIIRMSGETEEMRELDERIANELVYRKLEEFEKQGKYVSPQLVEQERQRAISRLQSMGRDRYVKLLESIKFDEFDVQVYVTNEEIDKGVLAQNLLGTLQLVGQNPNLGIDPAVIVRQLFDIMGLDVHQLAPKQNVQMQQMAQMMQPAPQQAPQLGTQNPMELVSEANTV